MKKIVFALLATLALVACNTSSVDIYVDFLYENLSLPDRTDYPRDYYVEQVRLSLQARAEMPWGIAEYGTCYMDNVIPDTVRKSY